MSLANRHAPLQGGFVTGVVGVGGNGVTIGVPTVIGKMAVVVRAGLPLSVMGHEMVPDVAEFTGPVKDSSPTPPTILSVAPARFEPDVTEHCTTPFVVTIVCVLSTGEMFVSAAERENVPVEETGKVSGPDVVDPEV